jgi:glycosyltransferase involved in cell wall biosynthesis
LPNATNSASLTDNRADRIRSAIVVMPAYNECRSVSASVSAALTWFREVVVVDDGSSDDTAEQARLAGALVIRHPVNLGQGAALQTGFDWALERGAAWVVTLDADGQHDPRDAAALLDLAVAQGAEVGLGSRFMGKAEGMPTSRWLLLKCALAFQNATAGIRLTDVHNGLRVLSAQALRQVHITQDRMAHASELVSQLGKCGLKVVEGPVTIRYTEYSLSKGQSSFGALQILLDLLMARLGR